LVDGIHQREGIWRSGSGLPNFASLTIGAIERGEILATQPYHTTRAAQVVDNAEAQSISPSRDLSAARPHVVQTLLPPTHVPRKSLREEWTVNSDKVYASVLQSPKSRLSHRGHRGTYQEVQPSHLPMGRVQQRAELAVSTIHYQFQRSAILQYYIYLAIRSTTSWTTTREAKNSTSCPSRTSPTFSKDAHPTMWLITCFI